ncbi:hypothetical protein SY27_04205 [Flavobacterium sp. 316]|uniref:hypothetical protein n=1 Tax=Flavobacterium sp. 316 TaxID=1603293 RepID=UPI0005DDA7D0|nr:hypothetical protein [Flavobacterium sp. 316]KIX21894.1 hypothetical protein SY27_04205 [Flavobacterium sp. 316]
MKNIINVIVVVLLISCTTKKENSKEEINSNEVTTENVVSEKVVLINPCDLVSMDDIALAFGVDTATIESYARNPYPDTNRCEFIWNDPNEVSKASQIMITISSNLEINEMPRKFSNMLRMDLEKGVMGTKQQIIKPTPIGGFGENAYHWAESEVQNVQKIKFHVNDMYLIEILFNTSAIVNQEEIKVKLIQVGKDIKQKI